MILKFQSGTPVLINLLKIISILGETNLSAHYNLSVYIYIKCSKSRAAYSGSFKCSPSVVSSQDLGSMALKGMSQSGAATIHFILLLRLAANLTEGQGFGPVAGRRVKPGWFGLGGGTSMGIEWGIPVWKAELILNFPEGISAGWRRSLKEILGGCNSVLYKALPVWEEEG